MKFLVFLIITISDIVHEELLVLSYFCNSPQKISILTSPRNDFIFLNERQVMIRNLILWFKLIESVQRLVDYMSLLGPSITILIQNEDEILCEFSIFSFASTKVCCIQNC